MALRLYRPDDERPGSEADPDLPEVLRRLEVPDCDCVRLPLPCKHPDRLAVRNGKVVAVPARRVLNWLGRVVPCDCPEFCPPCKHILAAWHEFPFDKWATLLSLACPEHYHDKPLPLAPALVLSREARVAVMAQREEDGFGLYHAGDLWRQSAWDDRIQVGLEIEQGSNGALADGQLRKAG